jgi:hypothetical protein
MANINSVHFKYLPMSMRTLFSMVLLVFGSAYCMAMIQVWVTHVGLDGKSYLTAQDLIIAYSGDKNGTKMETALKGPMSAMADDATKKVIYTWLHKGAPKEDFETTINPILQEHCVMCHNKDANPNLPDYTSWDGVEKVVKADTGMTIPTLIRVSHIHLFGITFIFFIMGLIYSHAYVRPTWFKCVVIAVPFLSLLADVASWYLTKMWTGFAWVVIISGALYGVAFTIMWFTSMYQMWLYKVPKELADSNGELPCIHGGN